MKKVLSILIFVVFTVCLLTACNNVELSLTFDANGGTFENGEETIEVTTDGVSKVSVPKNPTKDGYDFKGWFWDNDTYERAFTANSLLDEPIQSDMTVYAKWEIDGEEDNKPTIVALEGFEIENKMITKTEPVRNNVGTYDFFDKPILSQGSKFFVYKDEALNQEIKSKIVELGAGENIFYFAVYSNDEIQRTVYTVNIYKNVLTTITYYSDYESEQNKTIFKQQHSIEENENIEKPSSNPNKVGHTFEGWYKDKELTKKYNFTTDKAEKNLKLYANYTVNEYTISFESNDGSNVESITQNFGTNVIAPNKPTKYEHEFLGWYYNGMETEFIFDKMPAENVTLYAKWKTNQYNVELTKSINMAGEVTGSGAKDYNSEVTLNATTNEGYTWMGWYKDGSLINENESYTFTMPAENKLFEARWKANTATLYFNNNGGIGVMESIIINTGDYLPPNLFEKQDMYFLGWSENSEGQIEYNDKAKYTVETNLSEITLFAKWEIYILDEDNIFFGEYPQSIAKNEAIAEMSDIADADGYYTNDYDGKRYAKIVANPLREHYTFSNNSNVIEGECYYFKVEPIKWRIIEESSESTLLIADLILDNHNFDDVNNNYESSEIRAWLNDYFYNIAFNSLQQQIILTTKVDNSARSTHKQPNPYTCVDTNDKIFLLSYAEIKNSKYGFESDRSRDTFKQRLNSDYSISKGIYSNDDGYGSWWLRSPSYYGNSSVNFVDSLGWCEDLQNVDVIAFGVVPALKIQLS